MRSRQILCMLIEWGEIFRSLNLSRETGAKKIDTTENYAVNEPRYGCSADNRKTKRERYRGYVTQAVGERVDSRSHADEERETMIRPLWSRGRAKKSRNEPAIRRPRWLIDGSDFTRDRGDRVRKCVHLYTLRYTHYTPARKSVFIERRSTIRRRELFRRLRVTGLLEIDDAGPTGFYPRASSSTSHADSIPRHVGFRPIQIRKKRKRFWPLWVVLA